MVQDRNVDREAFEVKQEKKIIYTVDSFNNGIAFGQHTSEEEDPRGHFTLRLQEEGEVVKLRSRYLLEKNNPLQELESRLIRLSQQGKLSQATIYFGTSCDPFLPFEGKFDASMKFLELFKRYKPGMLKVQTRSPLIVIAMPVLTALGKHASVTIGLETHRDDLRQEYSPDLPRVEERLKTARALQRFGIEVQLQAAPVLPYGDWRKDALEFAEVLAENADYIHVGSLSDGSEKRDRQLRRTAVARRLAEDRKYHWLRPDSAQPLYDALEKIAPEKLQTPERPQLKKKQLDMFAA